MADAQGGFVGECVSYVKQACTGVPVTKLWVKGIKVKGATTLNEGTAIATFDSNGKYQGHAAIYVRQDTSGLVVWDQWVGHPVSVRRIRFRNGEGSKVNDGDQYYVID